MPRRSLTRRALVGLFAATTLTTAGSASGQVLSPSDLQRGMPAEAKERFSTPEPLDFNDHTGFHQIFDGRTLAGWDGDPTRWRVSGGLIVGETPASPVLDNTYLMYRAEAPRDFDLKLEIRIEAGGSGIQYRSRTGLPWLHPIKGAPPIDPRWAATGPQADIWPMSRLVSSVFSGQVYIENDPRGILAWRGDVTESAKGIHQRRVATIADPTDLAGHIATGSWNQYEIIARGGVLMHIINGRLMAIHINDDPTSPDNRAGLIGLELELQPAHIEFRNIWLKTLDPPASSNRRP